MIVMPLHLPVIKMLPSVPTRSSSNATLGSNSPMVFQTALGRRQHSAERRDPCQLARLICEGVHVASASLGQGHGDASVGNRLTESVMKDSTSK